MPLRSALVVADGHWRAAEIYSRAFDADLVVLSACGTARGAPAGGEGVASLARAFMYAGARATISTLWDVDDRDAAAFAAELYPRIAAGASLGDAMAGARRALRDQGEPPRVWAAYILTGAPSRHVRIAARERELDLLAPLLPLVAVALIACGSLLPKRARRST
jgi:CHAT domain-containing protein